MKKDSKGIAWLEVIIVVVIVVLAVKILVPSVFSKPTEINEDSAVRSVRMIIAAETNYAQAYDTGYSSSLKVLGPPPDAMPSASLAGYLDNELSAGAKEGYSFIYRAGPRDANGRIQSYTLNVNPIRPGVTGTKYYFVDQTGVIRENPSHPATVNDTPFGG